MSVTEKAEWNVDYFCTREVFETIMGNKVPFIYGDRNRRGNYTLTWDDGFDAKVIEIMDFEYDFHGTKIKVSDANAHLVNLITNDSTKMYHEASEKIKDLARTTTFYNTCKIFMNSKPDRDILEFRQIVHGYMSWNNSNGVVDFTKFKENTDK